MSNLPRYLAMHGETLLRLGYNPVPITPGYKFPKGLTNWQTLPVDAPQINRWLANGRANDGVGVLTCWTPAVDIDVYDEFAAAAMEDWVGRYIGIGPLRIGQYPKRLLVFRTDTPFTKVFSGLYVDQAGQESKVEILGNGQQFVTHAIHPDTRRPYEWPEGDLVDYPRHSLDPITQEQAISICRAFDEMAAQYVAAGQWTLKHPGNYVGGVSVQQAGPADALDVKPPVQDFTLDDARALLYTEPVFALVDASNDEWVRVGQALHHQFDGDYEAFLLWDEWSGHGSTYEGTDATQKRWDSFGRRNLSANAITLRTYIKMQRDAVAAAEDAAAAQVKANEQFRLDSLTRTITEFTGDWFDLVDSPVIKDCKNFLQHSTQQERHEALLCGVLKNRALNGTPALTGIRKAVRPAQGRAIRAVEPAADASPVQYTYTKEGFVEPTQTNVAAALQAGVCGSFWYDTFRDCIITALPGEPQYRLLTDNDYPRALMSLENEGFKSLPIEKVKHGIALEAERRKYDSAIQWANGLQWDGVSRIASFSSQYLGLPDTPYHQAVWFYVWTAMAGRVLQPGIKVDMVPVLISEEGLRKSSFVEALAPFPDAFAMLDMSRKEDDISRSMRGTIVMEWAELKGLKGRDEETIKQFVTKSFQSWTPKYKEMEGRYYRRCFFIGTTNDETPLPTNGKGRRWLPIRLQGFLNVDAVTRDAMQLWAEAVALFKQYGILWQAADDLAMAERDAYREEDIIGQLIAEWLKSMHLTEVGKTRADVPFRSSELIVSLEMSGRRNVTPQKVAPALRRLGFNNPSVYYPDSGKSERKWVKNNPL